MEISWVQVVVVAVAGVFLAVVSGLASAGVLAVFLRRTEPDGVAVGCGDR